MLFKYLATLLLIIWKFNLTAGCNKVKNIRQADQDPIGRYTLSKNLGRDCKSEIYTKKNIDDLDTLPECSGKMLPGIQTITHGYYPLSSSQLSRDIVFDLACSSEQKVIGNVSYSLALNISFETSKEAKYQTVQLQGVSVKRHWTNINEHIIYEYKYPQLLAHGTALKRTNSKSFYMIQIQQNGFKLSSRFLRPSRALLFRYRILPDLLEENINAYLEFAQRYGVAIRTDTYVGGIYEEFYSFTNSTLPNTLKEVLRLKTKHQDFPDTLVFASGSVGNSDKSNWFEKNMDNPVSMFSKIVPIYDFLEPKSNSIKKYSLKRLVTYLEKKHELFLLSNALAYFPTNLKIEKFIRKEIEKETNFLCVRDNIYNIAKTWILDNDNLLFDKFMLTCTHSTSYLPKNSEEYESYGLNRYYKLLPGLCFTRDFSHPECVSAHFTMPVGVNCIKFYANEECIGFVTYEITQQNREDLKWAILLSPSFSYC